MTAAALAAETAPEVAPLVPVAQKVTCCLSIVSTRLPAGPWLRLHPETVQRYVYCQAVASQSASAAVAMTAYCLWGSTKTVIIIYSSKTNGFKEPDTVE